MRTKKQLKLKVGEEIKSKIGDDIVFENKIKRMFEEQKTKKVFVFYLNRTGEYTTLQFGMCGHDDLELAQKLEEKAEEKFKEGGC